MSHLKGQLGRQLATAGVGLLMLALVGCGATANPSLGHVEGTVATKGGPSAATHPAEATIVATPLGGDPHDSYSTETDGAGTFAFDLPPGQYALTGTLTTPNRGDHLTPQDVTVTAGTTATLELFAIYP